MKTSRTDNVPRGNRLQQLVDDITNTQKDISTISDSMDKSTVQTLQSLQTFLAAAGATSLDQIIVKMKQEMTPDQQQSYDDMIAFNAKFGDVTDTTLQVSSIVFAVACVYKISFNMTAFYKVVGLTRVLRTYARSIKVLVTEGYDVGIEMLKTTRQAAQAVIGEFYHKEFADSSNFTKALGVAAEVSEGLMVMGLGIDAFILVLQAIEGAEQKTKLIDAIHQTQVIRLSMNVLYQQAEAIQANIDGLQLFATELAKHGSITDPFAGGDVAGQIAAQQKDVSLLQTEQTLEGGDANRNSYRDDDLSTNDVVSKAITDVNIQNTVVPAGTYYIVNAQTGTQWDLTASQTTPGFHNTGGDNQKWMLTVTGATSFSIKSKSGGVYASHVQGSRSVLPQFKTLQGAKFEDDWTISAGTQDGIFYITTTATGDDTLTGRVLDLSGGNAADYNPV
ncbi:hypothetical protein D9757_010736 [Collybiopsis confluens]|uniref:Ricin B lectin domain-containing protein n=1 Tax=Collybiopsis confluens TaxID=2823264 RepID=A0A8H5GZZ2_9AGAR|nr:hypothetical protein D9757_010736 [Collybiopsis confluens]